MMMMIDVLWPLLMVVICDPSRYQLDHRGASVKRLKTYNALLNQMFFIRRFENEQG